MKCKLKLVMWTTLSLIMGMIALTSSARAADEIEKNFTTPPDAARPWVYWFWLNGNITKEGITADLEAMKNAGIGGVLIMEVDQGAPVGPVDFMSTRWRELFQHVAAEANRLGLEVNMNNDGGWNGSGGPWIKPEESMQKVVCSETEVEGPKKFDGKLAHADDRGRLLSRYRSARRAHAGRVSASRIFNAKADYRCRFPGAAATEKLPPEMVIDGEEDRRI